MNAFRKLLLAPALLGLASPMAVQAQSLDMGTVDRYTQQQDIDRMRALEAQMGQVTSVSQFSDVQPTDWAYQALANLVEQYGCVAGYPDGTFKGNIAMTRYEAAALLNACLDRVTEMTAEIKRLMKEFEKELSVLKAKVDGLEAQTAELAATQFSTTTKLSGVAYFWLGGAEYSGSGSEKGKSPLVGTAAGAAEAAAFSDARKANALKILPGGALNNNTIWKSGDVKYLTKGATWSGYTGSNTGAYSGDPTSYGAADLALISYPGSPNVAGQAGAPQTLEGIVPGATSGQLGVTNLRGNQTVAFGTPGFTANPADDVPFYLTKGFVKKSAWTKGLTNSGVAIGGFTVDSTDLANLVNLGNASRRAKGAVGITYNSSVVNADNAPVGTYYNVADGGFYTNTNTYTDPFNLSIAEYGSLSKAQASTGYVKKAAKTFLKDLYKGDVELGEAVSFNYDVRLFFNTSFTGKDLLRTMLRAGNFGDSTWAGSPYPATGAEIAFEEPSGANSIAVNRVFYQFPVGSDITMTAGAVVRQDDMLAVWPSQYPADTILDFFTYAGAPGAYSLTLGQGAGAWWAKDGWSLSGNYVATNGRSSFSNRGGIGTDATQSTATAQLAYTADEWNLTAAYAYQQGNTYGGYIPVGTPLASNPFGFDSVDQTVSSVAVSGWYAPSDWGDWMPSISAGWGLNDYTAKSSLDIWGIEAVSNGDNAQSQSWYVGLQWSDVFLEGNYLGTAVGQPTFVSSNDSFLDSDESTFAWELWYKFQVTDNISVTPAVFYIDNPSGLGSNSVAGGVLKTTLNF